MKKMEFLGKMMKLLNITPQEVVNHFSGISFISSKKFVTPKLILPGMFEYADGLISSELIPENQLRGVIGSVSKDELLIWCLKSQQLKWSDEYWDARTKDLRLRGWEATATVLKMAKKLSQTAPAAEYCANYAQNGVEKGSAFLFSHFDAKLLHPNRNEVATAFAQLGITFDDILWSSSEFGRRLAWFIHWTSKDGVFGHDKNCVNDVRPVRRLEL